MLLSREELRNAEAALCGDDGRVLMELMKDLSLRNGRQRPSPALLRLALELGWVEGRGNGEPRLTEKGMKVADPLREFLFWDERGRRSHSDDVVPALSPAHFRGKRVLDLGSGFGCNLFTLQALADRVVGAELEPLYLQLTPLLARIAGVDAPPVVCARGESLPFRAGLFDLVVCFGAFQFMDFDRALPEVHRVLRPGGRFIVVFSSFLGYASYTMDRGRILLRPRALTRLLRDIYKMSLTPWLGRSHLAPTSPVYPPLRRMRRLFVRYGFTPNRQETRKVLHEYAFVADKPA